MADAVKPRIIVAFRLPDAAEAALNAQFDATFLEGVLPDDLSTLAGAEALVVTPPIQVTADVVARLPASIRVIATYSVGLDHVDVASIRASGREVAFTPDVLTDAVADTAMLLLLGATRRVNESIALVQSGAWEGWSPRQLVGLGLSGKTFGVFGMGRIGQAAAARAKAFGMEIAYHNRKRLAPTEEAGTLYMPDAQAFLATADVLLLASPLTPETRHFLNAERIAMMRNTAVVLNVGRGDLIDEDAFIPALQTGRLYAAGLDVFANEPNLDPRFYDMPNVFMLPHIGSSTVETRVAMAEALASGVEALLAGRSTANRVP